jgi:photosystem II stability/assembly factor-like uncharacterized protein
MRFLGTLLLALIPSIALANGRAPSTSTINFRRGMESQIAAGMTFGLVYSSDGGATWSWVCEEAVGYGGNYDPDYAFTATGALFATTFDGLKVNRDTCSYNPSTLSPTPPAIKFFSAITAGPDGAVYAAAADPTDAKIYKSTDDGATFPTSANPGQLMDWWQSIEVAPTDPNRVYLAGYRLAGQNKTFLLFRSTDAGAVFNALPVADFATMSSSIIDIVGISKIDVGGTLARDIVYARVTLSDNTVSDAIYRSIDGGQNWTKLLELAGTISFVARANGDLIAGTQALGAFKATETGTATLPTFTPLAGPPHINCLAENSAGEVWACTQNYGSPTAPKDDFGIMKSTDLVTWVGVLKFQNLIAPVTCSDGTVQKDRCDNELWCGLCAQLGCDPGRSCIVPDGPTVDGAPMKKATCCSSSSDDIPGLLAICTAVGFVAFRRRRRPV